MNQEKQRCPTCGQNMSLRQIPLYRGMVMALWRVFKWARQKGIHEFTRKDIKHLFINENDTARFGDWVMFGGLVYKERKAHYGLNMERCNEYFRNQYQIPTVIWKNPVTGELTKENYRFISGVPSILKFLNEDREFVAEYRPYQSKIEEDASGKQIITSTQESLL